MTDEQIIKIITTELEAQTLGGTEQYLEIHKFIYENDKLVIERIDRDSQKNSITVYLPVVGEKFYFKVYIDKTTETFIGLSTEPYNRVYFTATSETMTLKELAALTTLTFTEGWSKGDLRKNGKSEYKFSSIKFLPNPEPDTFENKLQKLLTFLEQDKEGVKILVEKAFGYIQVAMNFHDGNGMLGGPTINKECVNRMSGMGLEIDFDLYSEGNPFVDHRD
jgi:hypothetical protein